MFTLVETEREGGECCILPLPNCYFVLGNEKYTLPESRRLGNGGGMYKSGAVVCANIHHVYRLCCTVCFYVFLGGAGSMLKWARDT